MTKILKNLIYIFILFGVFIQSSVFASNKNLKIAFVGNLDSGKTNLINASTKKDFECKRNPTQHTSKIPHPLRYRDVTLMCDLFDTSGNQKVKNAIITDRLKCAHIAVITVDVSVNKKDQKFSDVIEQSFDEWVKIIRKVQPGAYILLAISKHDISKVNEQDLRDRCEHLKGWYRSRFDYVFTSAVTKEGIGNSDSQDDFSNNFWGKIRNIIQTENIISNLPEWNGTEEYKKASDSTKHWWECTIV